MKPAYPVLAEQVAPDVSRQWASTSARPRQRRPQVFGSWRRLSLRELARQRMGWKHTMKLTTDQRPELSKSNRLNTSLRGGPPQPAGAEHTRHTSPNSPGHHLTKRPRHSSWDLTGIWQPPAKAPMLHRPPTARLERPFRPTTFGHWYMQCKGYARLGRVTSPALIFGKSILSLGITNSFTIHLIRNELHWHHLPRQAHLLAPGRIHALLISILAIFPLLSAYSFLMVAQPLRRLQLRSGMTRPCNIWLVLWSSIVPPCGLFYLSLQLNRYWRQCVLAYASRATANQRPDRPTKQAA